MFNRRSERRDWEIVTGFLLNIYAVNAIVPVNAGENTITRLSTQSSVTIPFEQTFRDLSAQRNDARAPNLAAFNFCGCGWPQHMLVPKGTEAGSAYQLFVMLSNYDLDSVSNPVS